MVGGEGEGEGSFGLLDGSLIEGKGGREARGGWFGGGMKRWVGYALAVLRGVIALISGKIARCVCPFTNSFPQKGFFHHLCLCS